MLPPLASALIRLTARWMRWTWEGRAHLDGLIDGGEPFVFAFWHERILLLCPLVRLPRNGVAVLISNNRDGELIARVVRRLGATVIRGSTTKARRKGAVEKGGAQARREAAAYMDAGGAIALTPDGPRGPRREAQAGVAVLSSLAGAPVICAAYSTSGGRKLRSWDRFLLPRPFSRGAYVFAPPLPPPPRSDEAAVEAHRREIERTLTAVTDRADEIVGRPSG